MWQGRIALALTLAISVYGANVLSPASAEDGPQAATSDGRVQGVIEGSVEAYRGLPFAAPPVDDLRWRAPQPAAAWEGVRDATAFGSPCPQPPYPPLEALGADMSEDCLTLNVYTPADRADDARLPVLVYIHGGGFRNNSMENPGFDGHSFVAEQDIVVVTFNYRVARHGFFGHPALGSPAGEPIGNYGFLDQIAALEWVQRNIAVFGGNSDLVTIMGISAGSASVLNLMAISAAEGLFHRVIAMSAPARRYRYPNTEQNGYPSLRQEAEAYARFFELGEGDDAVAALRDVPWQAYYEPDALALQREMGMTMPAVDGDLIAAPAEEIFAAGRQAKVPLIVGVTSDEANIARRNAPDQLEIEAIRDGFGLHFDTLRALYGDLDDKTFGEAVWSDLTMLAGMRRTADLHDDHAPVYLYRLTYVPESIRSAFPGLPHGLDGHLIFDAGRPGQSKSRLYWTDEDGARARTLRARWAAFMRDGDPNVGGMTEWPRFDGDTRMSLALGVQDVVEPDFRGAQLDCLDGLLEEFCAGTADVPYFATTQLRPSCLTSTDE